MQAFICPNCHARLDVADGHQAERGMRQASGQPREWVFWVDGVELHHCAFGDNAAREPRWRELRERGLNARQHSARLCELARDVCRRTT